MSPRSLRLRLVVAWVVFIALLLQIAGIGLRLLFERSITRRTELELAADLRQLKRGMEVAPDGGITIVREPTDPQFDIVFGGRYWQVAENGEVVVRSSSLEDFSLVLPHGLDPGPAPLPTWVIGPEKQQLYAVASTHEARDGTGDRVRNLTIVTAVDAAEIRADTDKFSNDLFNSLGVLAVILTAAAWLHVSIGLKPLERVRASVAAVRAGRSQRLEGLFPDEVQPLVAETNMLLEAQETALRSARERAGDLAHGLKTPMAIMAAKSRQLRRQGEDAVATELEHQIENMRRHVERELARIRARGAVRTGLPRADAGKLFSDLVRAVQALPRGQEIAWDVALADGLELAADPDDLNNVLGNLVDNALKWATARIRIAVARDGHGVEIVVEDDGPGVPDDEVTRVLKRGERADDSMTGSGLGLAIVGDLVSLYQGTLALERSRLGGLKATVKLPDPAGAPLQ